MFEDLHETICFYCFWSVFYGLAPMIWFYPLNELDITGYEAYAAVWLIPVVTVIPLVRRFIGSRAGFALLELGMLAGVASFQMGSTLSRLQWLSAGNGAAVLYFCGKLFCGRTAGRMRSFWICLAGKLLFVASRLPLASIAPAWASHSLNWMIFSLFACSILTNLFWYMFNGGTKSSLQTAHPHTDAALVPLSRQIAYGLCLGSLLYLGHWLFGDLAVLSRWSVIGVTSPPSIVTPFYTSPLVFLALALGPFLAIYLPRFTSSLPYYMLGCSAFLATYWLDDYAGFICGLVTAVFFTSLSITAFPNLCRGHPAVTVGIGIIVYLAQIFFHVWTVAYNFVPGGVYTRERSDALIIFMCLTFLTPFLSTFSDAKQKMSSVPRSFWISVIVGLLIVLAGSGSRWPKQPHAEGKTLDASSRSFSVAIWTYHFGYDNQGWPSLTRTAQLFEETGADVIALLESDASKPYLGLNDLGLWLSERLGMFVDFGPSTKDHTWGNLLLSKYPIVNSTHHLLPSPHGELAPALHATLNMSGFLVDIVSTHMGNDRDVLDRQLQTEYLSNLTAHSPRPLVFLGYVTSKPYSPNYLHFRDKGLLLDIDPTDRQRFCEYIFYRRLIRQGYARISHGGLSDTEIQMARFSLPSPDQQLEDNALVETNPLKVEGWKRFSKVFGDFTEGHYHLWQHHFHMSTPKYFLQPPAKSL